MSPSHLVEALLAGLVLDDETCEAHPEMETLRALAETGGPGTGMLQWLLCAVDLPAARRVIRRSAWALLDLLERVDEGHAEGERNGCPLWSVLRHAPPWLARPVEPDDRLDDIALLLERDESYHGDWQALIEALHQAGSRSWQWAIRRCRCMQRFEREQGVNLRNLLESPQMEQCNLPHPRPRQLVGAAAPSPKGRRKQGGLGGGGVASSPPGRGSGTCAGGEGG
ncbi:MAG: hypothetical protein GXY79_10000 [Chloroflexi bacterium]|jgi:hypothetical protein|nr:hypothetical protein [Chloroflexota bacterium]